MQKFFETGLMAGTIIWIVCFICFAISQVGKMAAAQEKLDRNIQEQAQ